MKYWIALWAAKFSKILLKITRHNGTNFPGELAIKICPDFLRHIGKPARIIGVTGTNGKTTVCNLVIDMFASDGQQVLNNRLGSNTASGIGTSLINGVTFFGRPKYNTAVFELDERSAPRIYPYLTPDLLLITNLTRDSIMRNGHPEFISGILTRYIPKKSKLLLNADDLISVSVAPDNPRVYFGIDRMDSDVTACINRINDMRICPNCHTVLEYEYLRYHHIGRARCPACGFASPAYDYRGHNVDTVHRSIDIADQGQTQRYKLVNESIFNIYNVVSVVALFRELGFAREKISALLEQVKIVESRYNEEKVGSINVIMQIAKDRNAVGCSRAFDYVSGLSGDKELLLMMSNLVDAKHWSENTCWLYDCDFEFLNRSDIKNIVVVGPRCKDYALRLLLAGVPAEKIQPVFEELEGPEHFQYNENESIYVMYGTETIELAKKIVEKTKNAIRERGGATREN